MTAAIAADAPASTTTASFSPCERVISAKSSAEPNDDAADSAVAD